MRVWSACARLPNPSQPYDVVVLAHQPPRVDALPLARQIQTDPLLAAVPIVRWRASTRRSIRRSSAA